MAGEIRLQAATGLTIRALIVAEDGTVWDGSALVAVNTLSDANWTASLIACTEEQTSEAAGTGLYLANWPGSLSLLPIYSVAFFTGASPSPGDLVFGSQQDPTETIKGDTAAILEITGNSGVALTAAERAAVADAVLTRDVSNVEGVAGDHSLCYVVLAMSESNTVDNVGKLTIYRTNGTTEFAQKPLTTDAAADPVTGVS